MSRLLTGSFDAGAQIPSLALSAGEIPVAAMASLAGWWEADAGFSSDLGGRWYDKRFANGAYTYAQLPPVLEDISGVKRLRFGYASGVSFSGVDRGALMPSSDRDLLSATGFTVISVQRVALPAENTPVGGYVWSSRGPSGATLPGLNISGSTGDPVFRAGGVTISNASAVDLRDGNLHITRCTFDAAADTINVRADRGYINATVSGATTNPDTSQPGMLTPSIGAMISNADPQVLQTPFYGQLAAILFFNTVLDSTNAAIAENYLAAKYGITLV